MAEYHQHYRFIGGGILQTRRDQKRFRQKKKTPVEIPRAPTTSPVDAAPKIGICKMD